MPIIWTMDDQRIGRVVRALRRRVGWRQADLAEKAGCSRATVSETERGRLPEVRLLRGILRALDASLVLDVWWRAGALDRLLDVDHAAIVATVTSVLGAAGWEIRVEVTYNDFGDRGSIDVLAFHLGSASLLVIEVKTEIAAVEETLRKIDEKVRLAPNVARSRFGWTPKSSSRLLVLPDLSTPRRRIDSQAAIFDHVFPLRGRAIRSWIAEPHGPIAGLWFLSPIRDSSRIQRTFGRSRVRRPNQPPVNARSDI